MLTLASGRSSVVVAPEHGAGLTGWLAGGTPMLRRALPQATLGGDVHAMGCFPLLPYGNRLGHGRFRWLGCEYRVKRNFGDQPHAIHGLGWQRAWAVADAGPVSAALSLDHQPDETWPFAFHAVIGYRLSATVLEVTISLTSHHDGAAPAGIGLHPYFPKTHGPALRFAAMGAWANCPDAMPLRHGPLPADWRHDEARPVARSRLDNCFSGWAGTADVIAGPASLRIEASDIFRNLHVFTPAWADFFCAEPISHVPDALNRADLPVGQAMHVLRPGETLSGVVRLVATGAQAGGG